MKWRVALVLTIAAAPAAAVTEVETLVRSFNEFESSVAAMAPFESARNARARFVSMGFTCVSTEPVREYTETACLRRLASESCFYYQTVRMRNELQEGPLFDVETLRGLVTCEDRRHSEPDSVDSTRDDPIYLGCEMEEAVTKKRRSRYLFEFRPARNSLTLFRPREGAHVSRLPFRVTTNSAIGLGGVTTTSFQDFKYDAAQFSVNPFSGSAQMMYLSEQSAEQCRQRGDSACGMVVLLGNSEYGQCKQLWRTRDYDGHPILWLKRPKS
jgi:hypothetical protein